MPDQSPKARVNLGHTKMLGVKLHPDLLAYVAGRASENFCSQPEYVRRLILADMERARSAQVAS